MSGIRRTGEQQELRRYLLDELPQEESERLEQEYFSNPDLLARLQIAEDVLVQDFLDGRLESRAQARFLKSLKENEYRRRRVDEMKALREWSRANRPTGWASALLPRRLTWLAAAGLGVAVLGWQVAVPGRPAARLRATSVLAPGQLRSTGAAEVNVTGDGGVLELVLTGRPAVVSGLKVTISSPERPSAWNGTTEGDGSRVYVTLPAAALPRGDYLVEVYGANGPVASYPIRVERR